MLNHARGAGRDAWPRRASLLLLAVLLVAGCGSDEGTEDPTEDLVEDTSVDEDSAAPDTGPGDDTEADTGPGDDTEADTAEPVDAEADTADTADTTQDEVDPPDPPTLTLGEACEEDGECISGTCLEVFSQGNRFCSEQCANSTSCDGAFSDSWACVNLGTGSYCMASCTDDTCPSEHLCIEGIAVTGGTLDLCLNGQGLACDSQQDCAEGAVCQPISGGSAIMSFCFEAGAASGGLVAGEACTDEVTVGDPCLVPSDCPAGATCGPRLACVPDPAAQCAGGVCWDEAVCAGPCVEDEQCPSGMTCDGFSQRLGRGTDVSSDDLRTYIGLCRPFEGSASPCSTDVDCGAGEACSWGRSPDGALETRCRALGGSLLAAGSACVDDPATPATDEGSGACASELCLLGRCAGLCETSADCGAGDWQCLSIPLGTSGDSVSACVPGAACVTDADCGASASCEQVVTGEGVVGACRASYGTLARGEVCDPTTGQGQAAPCAADVDCEAIGAGWVCEVASGSCLPPAAEACLGGSARCAPEGLCTGSSACAVDSDCGDPALWRCEGRQRVVDDADTLGDSSDDAVVTVRRCRPFSGSGTACAKNTDCQVDGELCRVLFDADGAPSTVCGLGAPGGVPTGGLCGDQLSPPAFCQNPELCLGSEDDGVGYCSRLCERSLDCFGTSVCRPVQVSTNPPGSVIACVFEE